MCHSLIFSFLKNADKNRNSHRIQTRVSKEVPFLWSTVPWSRRSKLAANMPELCFLKEQGLGCRQSRRQQPGVLSKRTSRVINAVKTGGHISLYQLKLFSTFWLFSSGSYRNKTVCPAFVRKSVLAFCAGAFLISAVLFMMMMMMILLTVIPKVLFSGFRASTVSSDVMRRDSGTSVSSREPEACTESWNQVSRCWESGLPKL